MNQIIEEEKVKKKKKDGRDKGNDSSDQSTQF